MFLLHVDRNIMMLGILNRITKQLLVFTSLVIVANNVEIINRQLM